MYDRYALYFTPPAGPLAEVLADWLGWDPAEGRERVHPDLPGLPRPVAELTARPCKYGAHATLKPPFHLAPGHDRFALERVLDTFAAETRAVTLDGLQVNRLGRFLALTPLGDTATLNQLAADTVRGFDAFRAAPGDAELARRRKSRLSPRQEANLRDWGYPHVMEDFRFHITLTGPLPDADADVVQKALAQHIGPHLPAPFRIDGLSLLGSRPETGRFHLIRRVTLTG